MLLKQEQLHIHARLEMMQKFQEPCCPLRRTFITFKDQYNRVCAVCPWWEECTVIRSQKCNFISYYQTVTQNLIP